MRRGKVADIVFAVPCGIVAVARKPHIEACPVVKPELDVALTAGCAYRLHEKVVAVDSGSVFKHGSTCCDTFSGLRDIVVAGRGFIDLQ